MKHLKIVLDCRDEFSVPPQISFREEAEGGYTHTEKTSQQRHLKTGMRQPQPEECWLPPEAGKYKGHILQCLWKKCGPADLILDSGFQNQERTDFCGGHSFQQPQKMNALGQLWRDYYVKTFINRKAL